MTLGRSPNNWPCTLSYSSILFEEEEKIEEEKYHQIWMPKHVSEIQSCNLEKLNLFIGVVMLKR